MRIDAHPMRIGRCIRMANPNYNLPVMVMGQAPALENGSQGNLSTIEQIL